MITLEYNETQTDYTLETLVLAAQAGDREAFGELVIRYQDSVYATALRRLKDPQEAQELAQEVFLQAMEKIDQLRDPRCIGSWLRAIARRMAINRILRRRPEHATETEQIESRYFDLHTPLTRVLDGERRTQVREGLNRLKTMDRETLVAFYVEGRSLAQMSIDFDSPLGTIKRRLHVARKRLADELQDLATV